MAGEYIANNVLDNGVQYAITNGTRIDITSQVATSYGEATTTYTLGNKTSLTLTGPSDASAGTGRAAVVPAITDGAVTSDGTATHWALTDGSAELIATGPLSSSQGVTNGNTFTLDSIEIINRDATVT